MKQSQTPPQWFTGDMDKTGMTVVVLLYLSGKLKRLKESLGWIEFIFIWSVAGEAFEKTAFFQKKITVITNNKKDALLMQEIKILSKENEGRKFFMKFLPFGQLLSLCEDFWNCYWVFGSRAKTVIQKKEVLKKLRGILAFGEIERDMLVQYLSMTKQADFDTSIASVLLGQYLLAHPREPYSFKEHMDDEQIASLCVRLKSGNDLNIRDIFSLYRQTHSRVIPKFLWEVLDDRNQKLNLKQLYEEIQDARYRVARDEEHLSSVFQEDWLPVLKKLLVDLPSNILQNVDPVSVLSLLPKYDSSNPDIVAILERLVAEQKKRMFGMYYSSFPVFYNYAKIRLILNAYLESLEKDPSHMFIKNMEIYNICPEEKILIQMITSSIPTIEYAEENIIFFLDWLKSNRTDLYEKAKEVILSTGVINTVWENAKQYDRRKFITFSSHFL